MHFELRPRFLSGALVPCLWLCAGGARADGLIPGIDDWSRAMVLPSDAVWRGPRVAPPAPSPRPALGQRLDAPLAPLSVHGALELPEATLRAALTAGEAAFALWSAAGLFTPRGDGGAGGTSGYDVYFAPTPHDTDSGVDASAPLSELDAARAFAIVDPRIAPARLAACVAEALADALLRELDPAERAQARRASAAVFTELALGERCGGPEALPAPSVFGEDVERPALAAWLSALDAREAHATGRFLADAWQLARQRTWEGQGLRASPSLIEAVSALLGQADEPLVRVLGELAGEAGRSALAEGDEPRGLVRVPLARLPEHLSPSPPLAPLAARYVLVEVRDAQPGERLSVWLRGEYGVRWALSALRLDARFAPLARIDAKVRDAPAGELHVELFPGTAFVLVSVSNGSGRRVAYFEAEDDPLVRAVQLTLDRRVGF